MVLQRVRLQKNIKRELKRQVISLLAYYRLFINACISDYTASSEISLLEMNKNNKIYEYEPTEMPMS